MADEPIYTLANRSVSAAHLPLSPSSPKKILLWDQSLVLDRLGHLLAGASIIIAALLTATNWDWIQLWENQAQSIFFQVRGKITPPDNIVLLTIDDQSISIAEQYYRENPRLNAELQPLINFPFRRATYAKIVYKLVKAGAKSVALDVVFAGSSPYGIADDRQFRKILQKYGNKVTLAALYEESLGLSQGVIQQLTLPHQMFQQESVTIGSANFPLEVDGKIHRLAEEFHPQLAEINKSITKIYSFDQAVLSTAQVKYSHPQGSLIYYWGPQGTFNSIPLWYLFDKKNWHNYLNNGKFFQNKIVLVGATGSLSHDEHPVAVSASWLNPQQMSGVEIHANAIASLIKNQTIALVPTNAFSRGLFVLILLSTTTILVNLKKQGIKRLLLSICLAGIWAIISYGCFIYFHLAFPISTPLIAMTFIGLAYLITEVVREIHKKTPLESLIEQPSSLTIPDATTPQTAQQKPVKSKTLIQIDTILCDRYKILQVLGSGGFSETYIAEDVQLPDKPQCVVKQLKPANTTAEGLQLIRRLFNSEAQTLRKLGKHPQIPELLAYFEDEEEFYLVQEYIDGHPLSQEIPLGRALEEKVVINILHDILQTLVFVHENSVIHRDIKPSNIIRRHSDGKLVLIDFGAVKEVSTQQLENLEQSAFTIGIGTKGYAPNEQCFGRPQYNSDIYAVGMIGIKALTGRAPHQLEKDTNGEVKWADLAIASQPVRAILHQMVKSDCRERYQSVLEVLEALNKLVISGNSNTLIEQGDFSVDLMEDSSIEESTQPNSDEINLQLSLKGSREAEGAF